MKRGLILSVLILLLLCSCATTVRFDSLVPSQLNLGENQIIAVAPTTNGIFSPWYTKYIPLKIDSTMPVPEQIKKIESGYGYRTDKNIAEYATYAMLSALSDGVYKVVVPTLAGGYTMLFESSIDAITYDEYVTARAFENKNGKTCYNYYIVQKATLSFSYRLTDLITKKAVDAKAFYGHYPYFGFVNETLIGMVDENKKFTQYDYSIYDAETIYRSIINNFKTQIRDRLIPHYVTLSFSLMTSSDKKEFAEINKVIQQGYLTVGFDTYMNIYQQTGNLVAGYNCAVLYYAMGNPEAAISLAEQVYQNTMNPDVGKLIVKMRKAYEADQKARAQAGL